MLRAPMVVIFHRNVSDEDVITLCTSLHGVATISGEICSTGGETQRNINRNRWKELNYSVMKPRTTFFKMPELKFKQKNKAISLENQLISQYLSGFQTHSTYHNAY